MFQFLETIRVQDGMIYNLAFHQTRLQKTFAKYFKSTTPFDLEQVISIPTEAQKGLFKCRIIYSESNIEIKFLPYQLPKIKHLQIISIPSDFNYSFKYANREQLNLLFAQKGCADDILMVKNGHLTDCSFTNIALLKNGEWFTPHQPLLKGTQRAFLLSKGIIQPAQISLKNLYQYEKMRLFNAMIKWENQIEIENVLI